MSQTTESKSTALVLKAFDTPFNERDSAAAEKSFEPATDWRRRSLELRYQNA
jgi:hypothetical protein